MVNVKDIILGDTDEKMEDSSTVPVSQTQIPFFPSQFRIPVKLEPVASEGAVGPVKWPKCTKTYNSKWENDPLLKTWIARHPNDNGKVVCRFCQWVFRAHKNDLLDHTRTLKHQKNFMQNSTPEEFNQFVIELNEKLREKGNVVSNKRKTMLSNAATTTAISDFNPQSLTSVTAANSNIPSLANPTSNSSPFPSINSNSNGILRDVLENDLLWQDDGGEYMNAESPSSDPVNLILEEQQSPTSKTTGLYASSNNIGLTPMTTSININDINSNWSVGASPFLPKTSTTINSTPNCIPNEQTNESAQSLTLQSCTVKNNGRFNFTSTDVIRAIQQGTFTVRELCAFAKAATTKIEDSSPDTGTITPLSYK